MATTDQINALHHSQIVATPPDAVPDDPHSAAGDSPPASPAGNQEERQFVPQATHLNALRVMARGISHALRNPLGIISGAAQLAMAHPQDTALVVISMHQVYTATMRTALMMDNLLSFAQPRMEVVEPVDINEILELTLEQYTNQLKQLHITLVAAFQPAITPVTGSTVLLRQMCSNMILNACQAIDGEGTLIVTTRLLPGGTVEIVISDDGCGISAATLPSIFDPFFTTRPAGKSLGLGLTVCQSIIQAHKGSITVRSQPGAGSTFTVCLPAAISNQSTS